MFSQIYPVRLVTRSRQKEHSREQITANSTKILEAERGEIGKTIPCHQKQAIEWKTLEPQILKNPREPPGALPNYIHIPSLSFIIPFRIFRNSLQAKL